MDVLEASKASNKDEIRRLRDANKEYRQKLVALQKVSTCSLYAFCYSQTTFH